MRDLILGVSIFLGCWQAPLLAQQPTKPNILVLFADDFSYEAVRYRGMVDIDTPHLDRLAKRGTSFSQAYNMGSWHGAVCIASRTMLMTGRHLWDAEKTYPQTDRECQAGHLWPQLLKSAGYRTYFTGKWHVQADAKQAFDVARHVRPGMPKTVPEAYLRPQEGMPDQWRSDDKSLGGFWEGGTHWSEVVAADAIEFLHEANQHPAQPFFLYAAFNAPHDPRQAPREYLDRYPLSRIAVPNNFLAEYPYRQEIGCSPKLRDEMLAPFPRTEFAIKTHRKEYYALIEHLDAQIGRILGALDASPHAAKTWIFFTADHGLGVGHHGLMGKQNLYDHSVRVPFLVAGPGVPENHVVTTPIYLQDMMATTLELAGAAKPEHVWFQSLLPLLSGEAAPQPRTAIYGAYLNLQRSVTKEGWKLIVYPAANVQRLYDLTNDPDERKDLSANPSHQQRLLTLQSELQKLQTELDDPLAVN